MPMSKEPWCTRWRWIVVCNSRESRGRKKDWAGIGEIAVMFRGARAASVSLALVVALAVFAKAEVRKEFHYKVHHRAQPRFGSCRRFTFRRDRTRQCLSHDASMHPELFRRATDRSHSKAALPSDLFKQFHLTSPVHRLPVLAG